MIDYKGPDPHGKEPAGQHEAKQYAGRRSPHLEAQIALRVVRGMVSGRMKGMASEIRAWAHQAYMIVE